MRPAVLILLMLVAAPAVSGDLVIYRCTGEDGRTALRDTPCPPGQTQVEQRMERPPERPAAEPMEAPSAAPAQPDPAEPPAPPATGAATAPAVAVVVPPLFQCTTFDRKTYFDETGDGNRRCVPLSITRIGPQPPPTMAQACEWMVDDCRRLEGDAVCRGWTERLRDARRAVREAFSDTLAQDRAELARIEPIQRAACGR